MLIQIPKVLNSSQLSSIQQTLVQAKFVDGKLSAGKVAALVKNNQEVSMEPQLLQALNQLVMGALLKHPIYQQAVLPYRVAQPFYARYTAGMSYGWHVDDPVMGTEKSRYRSDVSTTIFLNSPEDYEGGELEIQTSFGHKLVKLQAGDAIAYPSSSLHRVKEVSNGMRLVAVTWVQSMVKAPAQREILYQLRSTYERLAEIIPEEDESKNLHIAYVNLVRMWTEI